MITLIHKDSIPGTSFRIDRDTQRLILVTSKTNIQIVLEQIMET